MPPVEERPSPNHGERRAGPIDMLILHYTGMPDAQSALDRLCDPASEVSAHFTVLEDGRILRMVDETRRAWHAGLSAWAGETDVNSRSIGIEIVNAGHPGGLPPYPDGQIESLISLCRDLVVRHPIPPHRILAHSDVAPGRKLDPGEHFPWNLLAAAGIGAWVEPVPLGGGRFLTPGESGEPVEALQAMLALYGYEIGVTGDYDRRTEDVVAAFQRHFRPAVVDGVADFSTISTLHALLASIP